MPLVPLLRALCRAVPPLRRALDRTSGGLAGKAFRQRDAGDRAAAFATALEGAALQERSRSPQAPLCWWMFVDLAGQQADHLTETERARVAELVDRAPGPGGMFAAASLQRIAGWRWDAGDRDGALAFARRAVLADPSWPHGHVFLGWVGLVTGRHDPLPHLREALRLSPECARTILENAELRAAPGLLRALALEP